MAHARTTRLGGLGLLMGLLASAAVGAAAAQPDQATLERGKAFVVAQCASCHATGPDDKSPVAAATPLRTLADRYRTDPVLTGALTTEFMGHHPGMPVFRPTPEELSAVIAYLRSIQPPFSR